MIHKDEPISSSFTYAINISFGFGILFEKVKQNKIFLSCYGNFSTHSGDNILALTPDTHLMQAKKSSIPCFCSTISFVT